MSCRPARAILCLLVVLALQPGSLALATGSRERIVYFTTFQHGLAGWSGVKRVWRVTPRYITADPHGNSVLVAPFVVRMKNYAVQSKVRVLTWKNRGAAEAAVGVLFRAPKTIAATYNNERKRRNAGLVAGLYRLQGTPSVGVKQAYARGGIWSQQYRYRPGRGLHTYRVEVRGVRIRVLVDGRSVLSLSWSDSLEGTRVGVVVSNAAVQVKGFRVTTL